MDIDTKQLSEVVLPRIELIADDERFYLMPNAEGYALSNYARLYKQVAEKSWHKVPMTYQREECYEVDGSIIPVHVLMEKTFFPNKKKIYLYCSDFSSCNSKRWNVSGLFAIENKEDLIEVLRAKMEHREPKIHESKKKHVLVGSVKYDKPIYKALKQKYYNMRSRATNQKVKNRYPNYMDTTIADEWIEDPQKFYQHILSNQYAYPGKLCIDKDLLRFGETNRYAPENVVLLPVYLNNIFTKDTSKLGYCIQKKVRDDGSTRFVVPQTAYVIQGEKQYDLSFERYIDALIAARKRKAAYIRKIVDAERQAGYIPCYILKAMTKWADRCELGLIKIWEPSESVLKEMGVI